MSQAVVVVAARHVQEEVYGGLGTPPEGGRKEEQEERNTCGTYTETGRHTHMCTHREGEGEEGRDMEGLHVAIVT
jgi:hypothetical protein